MVQTLSKFPACVEFHHLVCTSRIKQTYVQSTRLATEREASAATGTGEASCSGIAGLTSTRRGGRTENDGTGQVIMEGATLEVTVVVPQQWRTRWNMFLLKDYTLAMPPCLSATCSWIIWHDVGSLGLTLRLYYRKPLNVCGSLFSIFTPGIPFYQYAALILLLFCFSVAMSGNNTIKLSITIFTGVLKFPKHWSCDWLVNTSSVINHSERLRLCPACFGQQRHCWTLEQKQPNEGGASSLNEDSGNMWKMFLPHCVGIYQTHASAWATAKESRKTKCWIPWCQSQVCVSQLLQLVNESSSRAVGRKLKLCHFPLRWIYVGFCFVLGLSSSLGLVFRTQIFCRIPVAHFRI